jgi:hypothetical protein
LDALTRTPQGTGAGGIGSGISAAVAVHASSEQAERERRRAHVLERLQPVTLARPHPPGMSATDNTATSAAATDPAAILADLLRLNEPHRGSGAGGGGGGSSAYRTGAGGGGNEDRDRDRERERRHRPVGGQLPGLGAGSQRTRPVITGVSATTVLRMGAR